MMQENTTLEDGLVRFNTNPPCWKNIRKQGEEVSKDNILLKKGSVMDATTIPFAISAGVQSVPVWKWPKVGIISTGDELVDLHQYITKFIGSNINQHHCFAVGIQRNGFSSCRLRNR